MPLQKLALKPGMNREGTAYSTEGTWYDGDKVRFRSGLPEKIGGWTQYSPNQFLGYCRALWNWQALNQNQYLGVGTNIKYYIAFGGAYYDITPITTTETLTNPFSTTNTSKTVTVTDGTYGPSVGDYVIFSGGTSVGGLTITGEYKVAAIVSPTQYQIIAASAATSTATGGGTVTAQYELPVGLAVATIGTGWSTGPWGRGGWGSGYSSGIQEQLRLWSNDNFGQDLVIAPRGGAIYYWQASGGPSVRSQPLASLANSTAADIVSATFTSGVSTITVASATGIYPYSYITGTGIPANTYVTAAYVIGSTSVPISSTTTLASAGNYTFSYSGAYVPTQTNQVVTSAIQEFIIAFGANSYNGGVLPSPFNPMLVRWSDQANAYQWIPAVTNQSGEYALSNGSYIMGARATRQEILIWTDSALYTMQYVGYPYVWSFQILMDNITVISPNCMITVNNVTYWMGIGKFYRYNGTVQTLPCMLRQYIYDDINLSQAFQVFSGANEGYNEVWWWYVSYESNGNAIDKYVIYNYLDNVWTYGTMARTAWLDTGSRQFPIAADYNSRLLYHENGNDDVSTSSPQPITAYIQSSDFGIQATDGNTSGQHFGFIWRMLPDVNFNGSTVANPSVTITLYPRQNSGTAYGYADSPYVTSSQTYGNPAPSEYTVQLFTGEVYTRLRGRQMAFNIKSTGLGVAWQLGTPRFDVKQDGRR